MLQKPIKDSKHYIIGKSVKTTLIAVIINKISESNTFKFGKGCSCRNLKYTNNIYWHRKI